MLQLKLMFCTVSGHVIGSSEYLFIFQPVVFLCMRVLVSVWRLVLMASLEMGALDHARIVSIEYFHYHISSTAFYSGFGLQDCSECHHLPCCDTQ